MEIFHVFSNQMIIQSRFMWREAHTIDQDAWETKTHCAWINFECKCKIQYINNGPILSASFWSLFYDRHWGPNGWRLSSRGGNNSNIRYKLCVLNAKSIPIAPFSMTLIVMSHLLYMRRLPLLSMASLSFSARDTRCRFIVAHVYG